MIPVLYAKSETEYLSNGIGRLSDAVSCSVKENRLTGEYELTLTYRQSGKWYDQIKYDTTIKAIPRDGESAQLFDVYDIVDKMNGTVEVHARHVYFRLFGQPIKPFTATGLSDALSKVNANAVSGDTGFTFSTGITSSVAYEIATPADAGHILRGMEGSILDVYGGEYEHDNFMIYLKNRRGADNGVSIRFGKNIKDLVIETAGVAYNGAYPFWYKEEVGLVQGPLVTVSGGSPKPFYEVMDLSGDFDDKPTSSQLEDMAELKLGSGQPKVSFDIDFATLYEMHEFDALRALERVGMGDTVLVVVPHMNVSEKARVYMTEFDVLNEKMTKCGIGILKQDLAGTLAQIDAQSQADSRSLLKGIIATKSVNVYSLSSLAAGTATSVSSTTNINLSGYYPLEIVRMRGSDTLSFSNASLTRGVSSTTVNFTCRNNGSSAVSSVTISAIILYIKSEYATTI